MIIYSKKTKDLNIPRGLGNVAVDVMSGTTDTIGRDEAISLINAGDLSTLSQAKAYTDQKAASGRTYTNNAVAAGVASAKTYTDDAVNGEVLRIYGIINEETSAMTRTFNLSASSTTQERLAILNTAYEERDDQKWKGIRVTYQPDGQPYPDVYHLSNTVQTNPQGETLNMAAVSYNDGKVYLKNASLNYSAFTLGSETVIDTNECLEAFWLTGYTQYWDTAVEAINALFDRVDELYYGGSDTRNRFYKLRVFIAMNGEYVEFHPMRYANGKLILTYSGLYYGSAHDYYEGMSVLRLELQRDTQIQQGAMQEYFIAYSS